MENCTTTIRPANYPTLGEAHALLRQGLYFLARGAWLWIVAVMDSIRNRVETARARRMLRGLDDRMLADIGLRRDDIDRAVLR